MRFEDEKGVEKILQNLSGSSSGFNSAFLYLTEPLEPTEHDQRTLRINSDALEYDRKGKYPGTFYPTIGDDRDENIWISFESEDEFPETSAQAILSESPERTPSGQVVHYTISPIDRLEEYSDENEIHGINTNYQ